MAQRIVYWFRNDLRLLDNEALFTACNSSEEIIPVFVFDPRQYEKTRLGFRRTSALRAQQLIECVADLQKKIRAKGGDLLIRIGEPEKIIAEIAESFEANYVYTTKEIGPEETRIESSLSKNLKLLNIDIKLFWTDTLVHAAELPFPISKLPSSFAEFAEKMQGNLSVKDALPEPDKVKLPGQYEAGQLPALSDLQIGPEEISLETEAGSASQVSQANAVEALARYLKTLSDPAGFHTLIDSGISQLLALGNLSPRYVYQTIRLLPESEKQQNLLRDLLERDYFHWTLLRFGPRIFKPSGVKHLFAKRWSNENTVFEKWINGETEDPAVNAIMKRLKIEGDLPASERQASAEYLANTLDINWTWGAMYFESNLKDYEPSVTWGKWNKVAGVGQD
ncbi:deoxyribodipyrimidine photo-lyase, partial [Dyadobacter crusticola]|uniref:deoxyribodipyrimidine photo-lyase n=1 Tax=Dyadobacter crusticola TaxID=292407 RepID=UPI0004E1B149